MTSALSFDTLILILIATAAALSLAASKPSLSALFLLLEISLVCLYFLGQHKDLSQALASSLFLGVITLGLFGANIYLEKTVQKSAASLSKTSVFIGIVAVLGYWTMDHSRAIELLQTAQMPASFMPTDMFSVLLIFFTIISVIISALIMFSISKNDKDHGAL